MHDWPTACVGHLITLNMNLLLYQRPNDLVIGMNQLNWPNLFSFLFSLFGFISFLNDNCLDPGINLQCHASRISAPSRVSAQMSWPQQHYINVVGSDGLSCLDALEFRVSEHICVGHCLSGRQCINSTETFSPTLALLGLVLAFVGFV